ncbi:MAG: endo alpha-1,4 polygalactosaminidase [Kineosporiaceae bacterium]
MPTRDWPGRWRPPARVSWQWQLTGSLDLGVDADVYDVDVFTTSAAQVRQLHAQGRRVICYLNAGSYEPGRPDSTSYPAAILGQPLDGWPGERWLDVRRLDLVLPLIAARMDLCASKGFDGVEPDNVDGYVNDTGFDLTVADQERFNRELARLAHERGLAVGLKNDLDQVDVLQPAFDFAVNEQCVQERECSRLLPFVTAGKPVLHVEYDLQPASFCAMTGAMGFSSMHKPLALDASRTAC